MPGSWTTLTPLTFNAGTMLLLTDGTVVCQEVDAQGYGTSNWHRLAPDAFGNYENGTWSAIAPLPPNPAIPALAGGPANAPLYFSSRLLWDGRLYVPRGGDKPHKAGVGIFPPPIYGTLA